MNYIKHLAGFFDKVAKDDRLNPTHVSMYVSLFQFWNASRFQNPISISRSELMKVSKISAKATYHKCMKELNDYGYLQYKPSYNPFKGSIVYLFNFQTGNEHQQLLDHTKNETGTEQAQEPYINSNKQIKQNIANGSTSQSKKINQQIEIPKQEEIKEYFAAKNCNPIEAEKFYNYFQSNGWLVGGKTKMKDWKAAARNWMLNTEKYNNTSTTKHLSTTTNKNYNEPL